MLSLPDFIEKKVIISYPKYGQKISFKNDNIIVEDTDGKILLQDTCHKLFSVWIVGSTTLTSGILEKSKKFGFSVFLLSYSHRLYGHWNSPTEGNYILRKKQYLYEGEHIAKHLISNKINNQLLLLKGIRKKGQELKTEIESLATILENLKKTEDNFNILGLEGNASRTFFKNWFEPIGWQGRKPRTKFDLLNSILDIGYTYLFYFVECMLDLYGFDVYQGVYHRNFYQRKSLVCDIIEPFRCIIDAAILKSYNLGQIKKEHFTVIKGQYFLTKEQDKAYSQFLMRSILEYKSEIFSYVQAYYRCFARNKPIEEYPTFIIK